MIGFYKRGACAVFSCAFIAMGSAAMANSAPEEIRGVQQDQNGNAILITQGGSKIIVIGEGARLAEAFAQPKIIKAQENCREVGITVRGRSYMFGVSSGDPTPVLSKIICE